MILVFRIRQAHFGTILIMVRMHPLFLLVDVAYGQSGTQYCDGLRGPLVVYDPNDPLMQL
jgi:hypothetical protein